MSRKVRRHAELGESFKGVRSVVNVGDVPVTLEFGTEPFRPARYVRLIPGQVKKVEFGYASRLQQLDGGADYLPEPGQPRPQRPTRPSVVELLSGGRVLPTDDPRAVAFMAARRRRRKK